MIFRILLLFFIVTGLITCAFGVEKATVAILELQVQSGLSDYEASVLTDKIRESLFNTNRYIVLDRSAVDAILEELGFVQTGCTTNDCIISVGRMLSAKFMVIGSVGTISNTYNFALKMINVETGALSNIATLDFRQYTKDQFIAEASGEIVNKMLTEQGAEFQPSKKPKQRSSASESKFTVNIGYLFNRNTFKHQKHVLQHQVGFGYKISSRFLLKLEYVDYLNTKKNYFNDNLIVIGPRYSLNISKQIVAFSQLTLGYYKGQKAVKDYYYYYYYYTRYVGIERSCIYPGVGINIIINNTVSLEVMGSYLYKLPKKESEYSRGLDYSINAVFSL